jgi:hypothetical protein
VAAARTPTASLVRAVAFATAVVLIATGCGGASSRYVSNKAAQTYFKLPKEWQATQLRGDSFPFLVNDNVWAVFFAPEGLEPDALRDLIQAPAPIGLALVGQIEQGDYDTFDDLSLRVIPYYDDSGQAQYLDPIEVLNKQDDDLVRIYGLEQIARDGLRGYRMRYQIALAPDQPPIVYDQTTMVHDATHTYYLFRVTCQPACFAEYNGDINTILESLRIRRDQP